MHLLRSAAAVAFASSFAFATAHGQQAGVYPPGPPSHGPGGRQASVHDAFMANLARHCGQAFAGRVLDAPPDDPGFAGDPALVMHVRECSGSEVRIPVMAGDDRSRMWIFTRTAGGIDLRHDHRHSDGSAEPNTFYGAFVADTPLAVRPTSANRHEFKWVRNDTVVGWVVEIVPGERYTYGTQRDGVWRHRFEFDLGTPVPAPPDPWGHPPVGEPARLQAPQAAFMQAIRAHCGRAYHGRVTRRPEDDRIFRGGETLTVHFRVCGPNRVELPFHVEENRSRTWLLTPTTAGLDLRHDHRHPDGRPEENTWYGAHTRQAGTATRQEFLREGGEVSTGWAMEIIPDERFTYGTLRDGEWTYRLDFDLTRPVPAPPAPWGHERER
jgi:hypothetical protein